MRLPRLLHRRRVQIIQILCRALDLLVVRERGVFLGTAGVQEAGRVERDGVLLAAEVLDVDCVRDLLDRKRVG